MMQSWDQFPAAAPTAPQPIIARTPPPVRPVEAATDEANLERIRLANEAARRDSTRPAAPSGYTDLPNGNLQAITGGPADPASRPPRTRQLPVAAYNTVEQGATGYRDLTRLANTFNDNYAGLGSGIENTIQNYANFGTEGQNQWWADLASADNILRNALFGASLTAGEQAAWERTTVTPNMRPELIRDNLARRQELARDLLRRRSRAFRAGGYNEDEIREALGENASVMDDDPPTTAQRNEAPPVMGAPGGTPPPAGGVPGPPAPNGERMDRTTVNIGEQGADDVSLNTGATQSVADPALAGINAHVQGMLRSGAPDAEIRQYIQDRGVPVAQIPNFQQVLDFRRAHPTYRGAYRVELDQHLVPQSLTRQVLTNVADSAPGAYAVAAGNMVTGQQIPNIVGATGGDAELARVGVGQIRDRHPIASVAGDISGGAMVYGGVQGGARAGLNALESAAPSAFARLPAVITGARGAAAAEEGAAALAPYSGAAASRATLAPSATLAPRAIATDVGVGAYESPGNRIEGGLIGGATGLGGRFAINSAGRAVSPTGGDLAPFYEEGGVPSIGQRMGGVANRFEQAFQSIPVTGNVQRGARTAAQDQWQIGGFNRALRNLPDAPQLHINAEPGVGPHAFAQDAFDKAYDRVHQRVRVVSDEELQRDLATIREQAGLLSDQSASHLERILTNSVERRLNNTGGALSGDDLQQALSEVRRTARNIRSNPNGDRELADTLDDVSDAVHANATRHSPPEAISTLNKINRGYAMLVRIENAANRVGQGEPGHYTPRALLNAERQAGGLRGRNYSSGQGLMTNYARAGLKLGQNVPDSGTFERAATVGSMAGATQFVSPYFAAPWAIDTLANLPGARDAVNWALKPNRASIRPITDEIREQLQARAGIGSQIGIPAAVAAYGGREGP